MRVIHVILAINEGTIGLSYSVVDCVIDLVLLAKEKQENAGLPEK